MILMREATHERKGIKVLSSLERNSNFCASENRAALKRKKRRPSLEKEIFLSEGFVGGVFVFGVLGGGGLGFWGGVFGGGGVWGFCGGFCLSAERGALAPSSGGGDRTGERNASRERRKSMLVSSTQQESSFAYREKKVLCRRFPLL